MTKPYLCIYHGNCADGFTSAWVVRKALGKDNVQFVAGSYGEAPPDCVDRAVVIVDFSYPYEVLREMAYYCRSVLILDHHETAERNLDGIFDLPKVDGVFDMARSGAMITWNWFFPNKPAPMLVRHVEDRDLWKFNMDGTREIQAAIFSYEYSFNLWDKTANLLETGEGWDTLFNQGAAIERKHHKDVKELVRVCKRPMEIGGVIVPVCSLPYTLVSDAAGMMALDAPFAACYWDTEKYRVFGLRSRKDGGTNVAKIAEQYGGGGHANAAGFRIPIEKALHNRASAD